MPKYFHRMKGGLDCHTRKLNVYHLLLYHVSSQKLLVQNSVNCLSNIGEFVNEVVSYCATPSKLYVHNATLSYINIKRDFCFMFCLDLI